MGGRQFCSGGRETTKLNLAKTDGARGKLSLRTATQPYQRRGAGTWQLAAFLNRGMRPAQQRAEVHPADVQRGGPCTRRLALSDESRWGVLELRVPRTGLGGVAAQVREQDFRSAPSVKAELEGGRGELRPAKRMRCFQRLNFGGIADMKALARDPDQKPEDGCVKKSKSRPGTKDDTFPKS